MRYFTRELGTLVSCDLRWKPPTELGVGLRGLEIGFFLQIWIMKVPCRWATTSHCRSVICVWANHRDASSTSSVRSCHDSTTLVEGLFQLNAVPVLSTSINARRISQVTCLLSLRGLPLASKKAFGFTFGYSTHVALLKHHPNTKHCSLAKMSQLPKLRGRTNGQTMQELPKRSYSLGEIELTCMKLRTWTTSSSLSLGMRWSSSVVRNCELLK